MTHHTPHPTPHTPHPTPHTPHPTPDSLSLLLDRKIEPQPNAYCLDWKKITLLWQCYLQSRSY
ncbi:hypothetical protein B7486_28650 [cyanobacterium TDX16]|nr:hypothetical protein B7486_28650 [cyanobacterium TDX16]